LLDTVSRMNIPLGIAWYVSEDGIKADLKGIIWCESADWIKM